MDDFFRIVAIVYITSMAVVITEFVIRLATNVRNGKQVHPNAVAYLIRALIVAPFSALIILGICFLDFCDEFQQLLGRVLRRNDNGQDRA